MICTTYLLYVIYIVIYTLYDNYAQSFNNVRSVRYFQREIFDLIFVRQSNWKMETMIVTISTILLLLLLIVDCYTWWYLFFALLSLLTVITHYHNMFRFCFFLSFTLYSFSRNVSLSNITLVIMYSVFCWVEMYVFSFLLWKWGKTWENQQ